MKPGALDIEVQQGDRFELMLRLRNPNNADGTPGTRLDLTGYLARSQVRNSSGTVVATFTCIVPDQAVLSNRGTVLCVLLPSETSALTPGEKAYSYDVEVFMGTDYVQTYISGKVTVGSQVTKP